MSFTASGSWIIQRVVDNKIKTTLCESPDDMINHALYLYLSATASSTDIKAFDDLVASVRRTIMEERKNQGLDHG